MLLIYITLRWQSFHRCARAERTFYPRVLSELRICVGTYRRDNHDGDRKSGCLESAFRHRAQGHPIHFMFCSRVGWGFRGRRIEWRYFELDQMQ